MNSNVIRLSIEQLHALKSALEATVSGDIEGNFSDLEGRALLAFWREYGSNTNPQVAPQAEILGLVLDAIERAEVLA